MPLNWELYTPNDVEQWIEKLYYERGIQNPADLSIDLIAKAFDIQVFYYEGPCFAEWQEDGGYSFIFLDNRMSLLEQRMNFFHELCHPLRHVGEQDKLPQSFRHLQEIQANQFRLYAALPFYMLENFDYSQSNLNSLTMLSETFHFPLNFVKRRMDQIQRRMWLEQRNREIRKKDTPRPIIYSESTNKLLEQLHRQVAERRAGYKLLDT